MKTFTINDIRSLRPCYDPARFLPEGWQGTALDILAVENCPAEDRLWVVLHEECIDDRTIRLFAVWCARQALALIDPDPRSVAACDVAERYANGDATVDELAAARAAAWAAAEAARYAAGDAWYAARAAAGDAAEAAAWDASRAAAWYAARAAAGDAAEAAAWDAARAAARDAAGDAAIAAQVGHLHEMLLVTDAARF